MESVRFVCILHLCKWGEQQNTGSIPDWLAHFADIKCLKIAI